jgi:hypothetical protein
MKKILIALTALLFSVQASAQFTAGQVLSAAALNSALAAKTTNASAAITGGTITGLSAPIGFANTPAATGTTSQLQYLQGATGSVARSLTSVFQDSISLLDFGADPTGVTDSSIAFSNFIAAVKTTGRAGHMPAGTYKINTAQVIDLASISPKGIYIYGDGQYQTMLDLTSVSASPAFSIIDTGNAGGGGFYSTFANFGIKGNIAGTLLQIGKTDFSDALNEFKFDNLWIGNNSASASAIGIQVNYVLNTHFNAVIAANNGHGDAWQINAGAFNIWAGGSGTYGDNGYHLTAGGPGTGAIAGNTFIGIDHEVNAVNDVKIDTANAQGNTWIGGTFVYTPGTTYAFAASAGSDNTIISPMTLGYPSGTPNYANFFNGSIGVSLVNKFSQATFYGGTINSSAPNSSSRGVFLQTNGSNRWGSYATSQTESGGNAGSNFSISRYNDSGVFIDSPIGITRSSGLVNINDGLAVNGSITASTTGAMPLYGTTGTGVNAPHIITGSVALSSGSATVTLSSSAVFTSSSTYTCTANDATAANAVKIGQTSGTSITFTGTSTDTVQFMCAGN